MSNERLQVYNWNKHEGPSTPIRAPKIQVEIDDETWRDGMQGTHVITHPHTENKALYIAAAATFGYVDHFDIGFPGSGERHRQEIISLVNGAQEQKLPVSFSAAGRGAAIDDITAILEVAQKTGYPLGADLFLDGSSLRAEVEQWDRTEKLQQLKNNISIVKKEGLPVMFVPERASTTSPEELFEVCDIAASLGVDRIAIADTTGELNSYGTTQLFREVFDKVGSHYPDIKFDFHEHDDLGMGIANSMVAAQEGVDRLHATARGIGERAGNVNLEKLLVVLKLQGFRDIDTRNIQEFARLAARILSVPILDHEPIVGERSTETASGVHASTYEKVQRGEGLPPIYFAFPPESVGLRPHVRIGPMSGMANVRAFCEEIGIKDVTDEKAHELLIFAKERWALLSEDDVRLFLGRTRP